MLKLKPPLTVTEAEFEEMLDRIESVIAFVDAAVAGTDQARSTASRTGS